MYKYQNQNHDLTSAELSILNSGVIQRLALDWQMMDIAEKTLVLVSILVL